MSATTQEQFADFFDKDALRVPEPIYKLESGGLRYYYDFDEDGAPRFQPSVTTLISKVLPTSPHLMKWAAQMGWEQAEAYKMERARYGTIMHILIKLFLLGNDIDLDAPLYEPLAETGYFNDGAPNTATPDELNKWEHELKKDLLAFAQFRIDYDVKPLAIEMPLISHKIGVGGCLDMPCTMRVPIKGAFGSKLKTGKNKGKKKVITIRRKMRALVDFKSGRNGFYQSSEAQLHIYRALWNEKHPNMKINRVFNWSPKDWRNEPGYNLKDQTQSSIAEQLPLLLKLGAMQFRQQSKSIAIFSGVLGLNSQPGKLFKRCQLSEFVQNEILLNTINQQHEA